MKVFAFASLCRNLLINIVIDIPAGMEDAEEGVDEEDEEDSTGDEQEDNADEGMQRLRDALELDTPHEDAWAQYAMFGDGQRSTFYWFALLKESSLTTYTGNTNRDRADARVLQVAGSNVNARDLGPHPLLSDRSRAPPAPQALTRRHHTRGSNAMDLLRSLGNLNAGPALQFIEQMMSLGGMDNLGGPGAQGALQIVQGPDGQLQATILPSGAHIRSSRHRSHPEAQPNPQSNSPPPALTPTVTSARWDQEARLIQGAVPTADRLRPLPNHLLNILTPKAKPSHLKNGADDNSVENKTDLMLDSDNDSDLEQLPTVPDQVTSVSPPDETPISSDDVLSAEERLGPNTQTVESAAEAMEGVTMQEPDSSLATVLALARSLGESLPNADPGSTSQAVTNDTPIVAAESPSDVASNAAANAEEVAEASTSAPRVTIQVHGRTVDITDTGIDPTFLEALPDDMREEVINQHFRETRHRASATGNTNIPSHISPEFLEALPPELRAEVIQQEALEHRRSARADARQGDDGPALPVEMDPASFFATLDDPNLRQAVLMEHLAQGDQDFMATLSPDLLAEAEAIRSRGRMRPSRPPGRPPNAMATRMLESLTKADKTSTLKEPIQILDKAGIATLVRLLFLPQQLDRGILESILSNLCVHGKTRVELLSLLLSILQDGTQDASAVDRTFTQMSVRATKLTTPKASNRRDHSESSSIANDVAPNIIAQRCLDAILYLVTHSHRNVLYFLTPQDNLKTFKGSSKKSKGKTKAPTNTFPIVCLLNLLERSDILKSTAIMDVLTFILSIVTKNIPRAVESKNKEQNQQAAAPVTESITSASTTVTSSVPFEIPANGVETAQPPAATTQTVPTGSQAQVNPIDDLLGNSGLNQIPDIPPSALRLLVNILDGECSSRTFSQTQTLIQNLSYLPDTRDLISKELTVQAQELEHVLQADITSLASTLETTSIAGEIPTSVIAKFSKASSPQTKLLRILKTIDHMYSPPKKSVLPVANPPDDKAETSEVRKIYLSLNYNAVWEGLSKCLDAIDDKPDMIHIGTVLLPLVEALMVVVKTIGPLSPQSPRAAFQALSPGKSPAASDSGQDALDILFNQFTRRHRTILNTLVRNAPSLISGSFGVLIRNSAVLDFDNKRNYFNQQLHRHGHRDHHFGTLQVCRFQNTRVFQNLQFLLAVECTETVHFRRFLPKLESTYAGSDQARQIISKIL